MLVGAGFVQYYKILPLYYSLSAIKKIFAKLIKFMENKTVTLQKFLK